MHTLPPRRVTGESGFTLLEVLLVVAILGTVAAMSIMATPVFTRHARAEAGVAQAEELFRAAREMALSERRNVEVRFIGTNALQIVRQDLPSGTTVIRTVELESRMEFRLEPGVPDTPLLFGATSATAFGTSPTRMFTSEGTFVDAAGDPLNGTLFMAIPGQANTARALTVFGATALLEAWQWDGRAWHQ